MAFENKGTVDLDSKVHGIRTEAIERFERSGFPTRKDEEWKYTSLNSLIKTDYSVFPKADTAIEFKEVKQYFQQTIYRPENGSVALPETPGLGLVLDPERIEQEEIVSF